MHLEEGMFYSLYTSSEEYLASNFNVFLPAEIFRSQTTKGIWIARCGGIEPCTVVMDLEGTDGRERGEVCTLALFIFGSFKI